MKAVTFNKSSWHYWLVKKFTGFENYKISKDICTYTRYLIGALIQATCVFIVVGGMLSLMSWGLINMIWWLFDHAHKFDKLAFIGSTLLTAITLFISLMAIATFIQMMKEKRRKNHISSAPGPLATMYKHWKEKTCVKGEFK